MCWAKSFTTDISTLLKSGALFGVVAMISFPTSLAGTQLIIIGMRHVKWWLTKGGYSGHMSLQVLQFFATFSPQEMTKTKKQLNSFASVLVSLVYSWKWVGLVGIVRRVVFHMQPLLPSLAVTCSLKKSLSACPMECFITCLRRTNFSQSIPDPLFQAFLWSRFPDFKSSAG